jgi:hypothetical protein
MRFLTILLITTAGLAQGDKPPATPTPAPKPPEMTWEQKFKAQQIMAKFTALQIAMQTERDKFLKLSAEVCGKDAHIESVAKSGDDEPACVSNTSSPNQPK